jgi:hypothetical protein
MKKFFAIFAIAGVMVSCNNSGENTTNNDSANKTGDTATMSAPAISTQDTTGTGSTMGDTTGTRTTTGDTTKVSH